MKKALLTLFTITAATLGANASIVFSELFNYSDGGIVSNSAGIWINKQRNRRHHGRQQ